MSAVRPFGPRGLERSPGGNRDCREDEIPHLRDHH